MTELTEIKGIVQRKRDLFTYYYSKQYKEWNGKYFDDRQVFCNIYSMVLESLEVMKNIDNTYIWCAFNKQYREDCNALDRIKATFCEK